MSTSKTSTQKVKAAERRLKCMELRKKGNTYQQIADELGVSRKTAWKHVTQALKELAEETKETAEELRTIEHQRLELQYQTAWEAYAVAKDQGDPQAMARLLETIRKIGESIRKLYGLDAPEEHKHHLTWADLAEAAAKGESGVQ